MPIRYRINIRGCVPQPSFTFQSMKKAGKIKYRIINHRKRPLCDYFGECKNLAYKEVYPDMIKGGNRGWSYLCKKHFYQERKKFKGKLPCCSVD